MKLPIDFKTTPPPIRAKYFEESEPVLAPWFIFGESDGGRIVDIATANFGDVFTSVPRHHADRLLKARDRFMDEIRAVLSEAETVYDAKGSAFGHIVLRDGQTFARVVVESTTKLGEHIDLFDAYGQPLGYMIFGEEGPIRQIGA